MHEQAVSPLRRWSATIELLPVIAMIIFIKYCSTISGSSRSATRLRRASGLSSRHNEDPRTFVTSNSVG
jgi:hypothetical protein